MVQTTATITATPKKAPVTKRSASKPVAAKSPVPEAPQDPIKTMGKRELIERVVIASGIKKKAAKPVVEAMLKELGDALARGETLNLQPFGKGIVKNRKDLENAEIIELRLRRSKIALRAAEASISATPRDPLAEAAE